MPKTNAFIVDHTYRVIDGQPKVYIFGRLESGESFLTINDYRAFFYIRKADQKKAEKLVEFFKIEDTTLQSFQNEPVMKVFTAEPRLVPDVRKILEAEGIPCFEADVRFTQRFLMEHDILATMTIEGEYTQGTSDKGGAEKNSRGVDRIYEQPKLTPAETDIPLKVLSIDLETSSADGDLLCVSLYGKWCGNGKEKRAKEKQHKDNKPYEEVLFICNKRTHEQAAREKIVDAKGVTIVEDEKALLELLRERILDYDPDIVTGWNVIDFDLAFLKDKCDVHKVPFVWGRTEWPNRLRLESLFARDSKADIPGRMVLDGIQLLRSSFVALDDYKLNTAATEILGEEKLITAKDKGAEINRQYRQEPEKLAAYNLKDSELVINILDAKNIIELTILRSKLVGLPMERVRASIASLDSVYLRELHKEGVVAPSGAFQEKDRGITGGFVKSSTPGIYEYVIVLDFKSLYPSIMRTFNIDPYDHRPGCKKLDAKEELIKAPNGTCFVKRNGILPKLLQKLWEQRDAAKQRKDSVASYAIKILMNSFFGVMASPNCRFFSMELANGITHFAQHFIKLTIKQLEKQGYQVIYGDTDSVFVNLDVKSYDEADAAGRAIQDSVNTYIDAYITKEYGIDNHLELEFEKTYRKFLMPRTRGTMEGSKKRYAGLLVKKRASGKLDEAMDFTGLEFVRRDWTELAKEFQLNLLKKIFHEQEVAAWVKQFVEDVKAGKHDDLLVYRKAVRKDLDSYVKTTPQHVKAARILVEKEGALGSNVIEYVITKSGPEPVGYESASIDYDHYIEKQVKPIADSVLCFFDTNFDDVVAGTQQKTLFGY